MEAPRGAREPTGTNGPTLNNTTPANTAKKGVTTRTGNKGRNHYTNHDQPTPPKQQSGDSVEHQSCGGHSTGETPSNIPNLEAKPGSANGTATDRLWESRTPPQHNQPRGTTRHTACRPSPFTPPPPPPHQTSSKIGWLNALRAHHRQERERAQE